MAVVNAKWRKWKVWWSFAVLYQFFYNARMDLIQIGILAGVWVAALAAVIVPLWLEHQRNTVRLRIIAKWTDETDPDIDPWGHLNVHVYNKGNRKAYISNIRLMSMGFSLKCRSFLFERSIDEGETAICNFGFSEICDKPFPPQGKYEMSEKQKVDECLKRMMVVVEIRGGQLFKKPIGKELKDLRQKIRRWQGD